MKKKTTDVKPLEFQILNIQNIDILHGEGTAAQFNGTTNCVSNKPSLT